MFKPSVTLIYSGGEKYLILYVCPLTKKNNNSIKLYVYLNSERQNNKKTEKHISKKLEIDLHLNESNKYLTPSQNMI